MTGTVAQTNWKKLVLQMLGGIFVGAASTAAVLAALEGQGLDPKSPDQVVAMITGMIYAVIGLMVGLGAMMPGVGARFLNVEDAEDLRDQRQILGLSSAACLLIGLLFLMLAAIPAGGSGGPVAPQAAAWIVGGALVAIIALTRVTNRRVDELTRQISLEASSLTLQAGLVLFGGWAALAHLGLADWIGPLALIAGMALLQLVAIFWVAGRRGLMVPEKTR